MNTNYKTTAADVLMYLPTLQDKFEELLGESNELGQLFIHASFEAYHAYLQVETMPDDEWEVIKTKLNENINEKLNAILIYYQPMLTVIRKSRFVEVDKKLLKDIFDNFRELIYLLNHENRTNKPMNQ
jgi:hypothetical protein